MNETTWNTFIYCLKRWTEESLLFKDPEKWLQGLREELSENPKLEEEVRALGLKIELRLQSLLLDADLSADEIFEYMRLPTTAIDIIDSDGGLEQWKRQRRSCQRSAMKIS